MRLWQYDVEPIELTISIWSGSTYSEEVQLESHWESKIQTLCFGIRSQRVCTQ